MSKRKPRDNKEEKKINIWNVSYECEKWERPIECTYIYCIYIFTNNLTHVRTKRNNKIIFSEQELRLFCVRCVTKFI